MAPEQLLASLQKLDVNNDGHWTQDGLPRLETVRLFAGDQTVNRDHITASAPDFTRLAAYNAQQAAQAPAALVTPAAAETPPAAQGTQSAAPPVLDPVQPDSPLATPEFTPPAEVQDERPLTMQEQLLDVEEELEDITRYLTSATKHKVKLQLRKDDLIAAIDKETPRNSNQHDIMAYLASQGKQLEERAQQIGRVKKIESDIGARLSDLVPKRSPLDAAMTRRTGYGRKRPGT